MTTRTALKLVIGLPVERARTHSSPSSWVNAHWDEVFPGRKLPETWQNVYHNETETATDWWAAAHAMEAAAFEHIVERLDRSASL